MRRARRPQGELSPPSLPGPRTYQPLLRGLRPSRRRRALGLLGWATWCVAALGVGVSGALWQYGQGVVSEFQSGGKKAVATEISQELGRAPDSGEQQAVFGDTRVTVAASQPTVFLLMGSDTREQGVRGNSDTLILVRLDRDRHTLSMLSIPRDLVVPIPKHSTFRINAAFQLGGPRLATATVREYFKVRIDHVAIVDFAGFQEIVNALGGVDLPVDTRYYHRNEPGGEQYDEIDLHPGYQRLSGEQALSFVRYRHTDSDYYRTARQALFLAELSRRLRATPASKLPGLVHIGAHSITSDIDSFSEVLDIGNAIRQVPPSRIYRFTVPTRSYTDSAGRYLLSADRADVARVMARWADPTRSFPAEEARSPHSALVPDLETTPSANVWYDSWQAASLVRSASPDMDVCTPQRLPAGASWSSDEPARAYTYNGRPAFAMTARLRSGANILWMQTMEMRPPVLDQPYDSVKVEGRTMRVYLDGRRVRMVAFQRGASQVWVTNTLRNDLSRATMLSLAAGCS